MKLKILAIINSLNAGGSETYLLRFIEHYRTDIYNWNVLSLNPSIGDLHQEYKDLGCNIIYKPLNYFNVFKIINFYTYLKKNNFDAIITFNGNFGGIPLWVAKLVGIEKRIAWYRRSSIAYKKNMFKSFYDRFVNRLVLQHSTNILSNSQHAFDYFFNKSHKNDNRFKVIANGVSKSHINSPFTKEELRMKFNIPQNVIVVGHVGRYDVSKNHETIFRVAKILKNEDEKFHFLFCGKNTDSKTFKMKLIEYKIDDICHTTGLVHNVGEIYKMMDLFYFPSLTEGQPNALIEAMISAVPIIASDIPPIRECVPSMAKHQLVSPLDVPSGVECIKYVMEHDTALTLQEWAEEEFNAFDRFNEFEQILLAP